VLSLAERSIEAQHSLLHIVRHRAARHWILIIGAFTLDKTKPKLVLKTELCGRVFRGCQKSNKCQKIVRRPVYKSASFTVGGLVTNCKSKAKTDQKVALLIAVFKSDLPRFSVTFLQRERP
jgi:hypothetical protein